MLRNSEIHYKNNGLFPILNMHFGKKYESGKNQGDEPGDMRYVRRAAGGIYKTCVCIIAKLILKLMPVKGHYDLTMDRTNWKCGDTNINILILRVICDCMAFLVVYTMMDKRGQLQYPRTHKTWSIVSKGLPEKAPLRAL